MIPTRRSPLVSRADSPSFRKLPTGSRKARPDGGYPKLWVSREIPGSSLRDAPE